MTKVKKKNRKYFRDFFTTIMDLKWCYHVIMFFSAFLISWIIFALGWLGLAYYHDDINPTDNGTEKCLNNVYDFSTAMLYSIETQTTIGYGFRVIGAHCPVATTLLIAQTCFGIFIQCFITGIVFAKMARPKRRSQTIVFSQNAVICMRDGFYNLIFRVGDLRKTHIIGTSIRALMVKSRETSEGELIPLCQYPLELVTESSITDSFVFFFWPVTVAHRITSSSPLWNLSAETMLTEQFEVIVILEGTTQTSGSLIQIRTSYIPNEIKWGQRLTPLFATLRSDDEYEIDFSNFHRTTPVSMRDCSALVYSECLDVNQFDPIETDYPTSFTSPPIIEKYGGNLHSRTLKNTRLQNLFNRNRLSTKPKLIKEKKTSAKEDAEQVNCEAETDTSLEIIVNSSLPPTYTSLTTVCGRNDDLESTSVETHTTVTIHDDTKGIDSSDGTPIWFRFGAEYDNDAFQESLA